MEHSPQLLQQHQSISVVLIAILQYLPYRGPLLTVCSRCLSRNLITILMLEPSSSQFNFAAVLLPDKPKAVLLLN